MDDWRTEEELDDLSPLAWVLNVVMAPNARWSNKERLVAIAIAKHLNDKDDEAWPSVKRIMGMTAILSDKTVRRAITNLTTGHFRLFEIVNKTSWMRGRPHQSHQFRLVRNVTMYRAAVNGDDVIRRRELQREERRETQRKRA